MFEDIFRALGRFLGSFVDFSEISSRVWESVVHFFEEHGRDLLEIVYDNKDDILDWIKDRIFGN